VSAAGGSASQVVRLRNEHTGRYLTILTALGPMEEPPAQVSLHSIVRPGAAAQATATAYRVGATTLNSDDTLFELLPPGKPDSGVTSALGEASVTRAMRNFRLRHILTRCFLQPLNRSSNAPSTAPFQGTRLWPVSALKTEGVGAALEARSVRRRNTLWKGAADSLATAQQNSERLWIMVPLTTPELVTLRLMTRAVREIESFLLRLAAALKVAPAEYAAPPLAGALSSGGVFSPDFFAAVSALGPFPIGALERLEHFRRGNGSSVPRAYAAGASVVDAEASAWNDERWGVPHMFEHYVAVADRSFLGNVSEGSRRIAFGAYRVGELMLSMLRQLPLVLQCARAAQAQGSEARTAHFAVAPAAASLPVKELFQTLVASGQLLCTAFDLDDDIGRAAAQRDISIIGKPFQRADDSVAVMERAMALHPTMARSLSAIFRGNPALLERVVDGLYASVPEAVVSLLLSGVSHPALWTLLSDLCVTSDGRAILENQSLIGRLAVVGQLAPLLGVDAGSGFPEHVSTEALRCRGIVSAGMIVPARRPLKSQLLMVIKNVWTPLAELHEELGKMTPTIRNRRRGSNEGIPARPPLSEQQSGKFGSGKFGSIKSLSRLRSWNAESESEGAAVMRDGVHGQGWHAYDILKCQLMLYVSVTSARHSANTALVQSVCNIDMLFLRQGLEDTDGVACDASLRAALCGLFSAFAIDVSPHYPAPAIDFLRIYNSMDHGEGKARIKSKSAGSSLSGVEEASVELHSAAGGRDPANERSRSTKARVVDSNFTFAKGVILKCVCVLRVVAAFACCASWLRLRVARRGRWPGGQKRGRGGGSHKHCPLCFSWCLGI
jgi:hypothetical protein